MLEWLQDPALRRRVNAGLDKGEAKNALAHPEANGERLESIEAKQRARMHSKL